MSQEIEKQVELAHQLYQKVKDEYAKSVVGQQTMLEKMFIGLMTGGHILLEGVPGLAKTQAVKTLSSFSGLEFSRIQFTPDLLPADLLGTQIYNQKAGTFSVKKGPLFANLILADEINRAPSKVQSALLEAMQEKQITIADETFKLEEPFLVLATQNPLEQEGTYPLPEAQLDRFMMKIIVTYPTPQEEREIVKRHSSAKSEEIKKILTPETILKLRKLVDAIYIDEKLVGYIVDLVTASREPSKHGIDPAHISYGISPRGSIYLAQAAKAYALLQGESYVKTEDIKAVALDVFRHRLGVSYEAEAEDITAEDIIKKIFDQVKIP